MAQKLHRYLIRQDRSTQEWSALVNMGIPLDKAELIGIFLEAILYGIFFSLFWITVLVLFHPNKAAYAQRRTLIPIASGMLLLATVHIIIDFVRIIQAFIDYIHANRGSATFYYQLLSNPLMVSKTALYATQTLLGDGMIIWRCYIVYNKKRSIVIAPVIILLLNGCAGCMVVWSLSQASPESNIFHTASSWIKIFFVTTMCVNISCTAAIAWRILTTRSSAYTSRNLMPVAIAVIESGSIYSLGVLAVLIAYLTGSNGQYPAVDVVVPLVGITFSLIILQIRFHIGSSSTPGGTTVGVERSPVLWTPHAQHNETLDITYPMHSMAIQITEEREIHLTDHEGQGKKDMSDLTISSQE